MVVVSVGGLILISNKKVENQRAGATDELIFDLICFAG